MSRLMYKLATFPSVLYASLYVCSQHNRKNGYCGRDRTRIILCVLEGKGTVTIVSYDKKLFVWGRA